MDFKTQIDSRLKLTQNSTNSRLKDSRLKDWYKSLKFIAFTSGPKLKWIVLFEHLQWKENGIYNDHFMISDITLEEVVLQEPTID